MNQKVEQALENEQFYLGSILAEGMLIEEATLSMEHFLKEEHKKLFKLLLEFRDENKTINLYSISQLGRKTVDSLGGIRYLTDMALSVPSISSFKVYEKQILSYWLINRASHLARDFIQRAEDAININLLNQLIQKLTELETKTVENTMNFKELLIKRHEDHLSSSAEGLTGVDSGFRELNTLTDGWQQGDLIIIGARPSMGKTAFALNSVLNGCLDDRVLATVFSLEMSKEQILDRLIAITGGINLMKMRNPNKNFTDSDWDRYTQATGYLEKVNIQIQNENEIPSMRTIIRRSKVEYKDKKHVVFIDFLTLIKPTGFEKNRHLEVEQIILELKRMAVNLQVPVIVLAQLNRQIEQRVDKKPVMSDLRESGSIEQTADIIIFLHREDYYNSDTELKGITEVHVAKNRNGAIGKTDMLFIKETNLFKEMCSERRE
ncbi:replicative DNA helicase [Priestia aryabhattai]|uniref:replicative DNA helicase n=1 Tax=Priestia aryabhattai TaxID=412384 RepID=UPI0027E43327|nr:replicative DNA helicase [Priestia aryabhattai]WJW97215.1 replicative DNA helicase [Priestia aryabhattai]